MPAPLVCGHCIGTVRYQEATDRRYESATLPLVSLSSLIGFPGLIGLITTYGVVAIVGVMVARRGCRRPARKREDGQGFLLRHSAWEKASAWSGLAVTGALVVTAFHGSETVVGTLLILVFAGLHGFWTFQLIRKTQNEIEVSEDGLVQRQGSFQSHVRWSDIQLIRESPSMISVVFRGKGEDVRVDKLMNGLITLFQFMQRKLPQRMFYIGLLCWGVSGAAALSGIRVTGDDESSEEV